MRTRIIVAAIAIPLLLLLIFLAPLWAFSVLVAAVSALCAFEFLRCVMPDAPRRFTVYAAVSGFVIPIGSAFLSGNTVPVTAIFLLTMAMFCEQLLSFRHNEPMTPQILPQVVFAGGIMPLLLTALVRIGMRENSAVYVLLPFVAAFSSDSGGYFAGKFLGRRKIFPHLSPNKTLEGCIGGAVAAIALMLLYGLILSLTGYKINYLCLALYGFFGSIACQLGDLAFSSIKRQYNIKDYGTLIPGHGGALDRFDSLHFTAPMLELLALLLPAIIRLAE